MSFLHISTRAEAVRTAPERFKQQLCRYGRWNRPEFETMHQALLAHRDNKADLPEDITRLGWAEVRCEVCKASVEAVATFDINGGEYTFDICAACMRDKATLVDEAMHE